MYENKSNEELLNMLINANEVGASQETCEKLYNEVLRRMNASQQSVHLTGLCVCPEEWSVDIHGNCSNCGLAKSPRK